MRYIFKFPDIGEGITEGKILKWYVQKGMAIKSGDPVVKMETDKVVTDIPSPKEGVIVSLFGNTRVCRLAKSPDAGAYPSLIYRTDSKITRFADNTLICPGAISAYILGTSHLILFIDEPGHNHITF